MQRFFGGKFGLFARTNLTQLIYLAKIVANGVEELKNAKLNFAKENNEHFQLATLPF